MNLASSFTLSDLYSSAFYLHKVKVFMEALS